MSLTKKPINYSKSARGTFLDCTLATVLEDDSAVNFSHFFFPRRYTCLDDLTSPLSSHLTPKLSDDMLLEVIGTVAKRLEVSLRKVRT